MMEEVATVVSVKETTVTVKSTVKSTCSGCQQVDSCASGQVSKAIGQKQLSITLQNNASLEIGDQVVLGIAEKALLSTAWIVYFLPLLGLILFSGIGQWLFVQQIVSNELLSVLLGFTGSFLGYKMASILLNSQQRKIAIEPVILKKLPKIIHSTPIV